MATIAFIGLGIMGLPMAGHLVDAGHKVVGYNRARRFGSDGLTGQQVNDTIVGIVQIENISALDNVERIAAVDGVDALFVGPADLSTALGVPGQLDSAVFKAAEARIIAAAHAAGISAGILSRDRDHADACLEAGYTFVGVASDAALLASITRSITAKKDPHV